MSHRLGLAVAASIVLLAKSGLAASESCKELVRQGRAYEGSRDEDRAMTRYSEAITLDTSCGPAYVALGVLRAKMGDGREADRVLTTGLERVPDLKEARLARARVRRAMGQREEANDDARAIIDAPGSESEGSRSLTVTALRETARWYDEDGARPAELAVWRRLYSLAMHADDASLTKEARNMVRALVIVVSIADPVTSPARKDAFRSMVARAAR